MARWRKHIADESTLLLAVSGGADSVFLLLHILEELRGAGNRLVVAHVNHGLRNAESDADEEFTEALAHRHGLEFFSQRIDLGTMHGTKPPDENTLRRMRLGVLKALAEQLGAAAIFLGHHRDDLAESFLLMALRGSGPTGLSGMSEVRQIAGMLFIRPLLKYTKQEIVDSLKAREQSWREDSSNASDAYRRNRLRHEVLPLLESIAPGAAGALAASAEVCGEMNTFYEEMLRGVRSGAVLHASESSIVFSTKYLRELTKSALLPGFFRGLISDFGTGDVPLLPNRETVRRVCERALEAKGDDAEFIVQEVRLSIGNRYGIAHRRAMSEEDAWWEAREELPMLFAREFEPMILKKEAPVGGRMVLVREEEKTGKALQGSIGLDAEKLAGELVLRRLAGEERIAAASGSKSVSECLREAGVPRSLRTHVLGVAAGEELVWIPGVRQSAATLVTEETRRVVLATLD